MPRILMIATGGTIASTAGKAGLTPTATGRELAQMVPLLDTICDLDFVQPMNIDSTNMGPDEWLCLSRVITQAWDSYDGFVVLHGTDTMAYTAAALSYLIQDSEKPIVLTGSQQPMASPFTDAKLNVYQSVLYASDPASRDVALVFGGMALCGTRARKQRTMSHNAFTSMNFPPLAVIRNNKIIRAGAPCATTPQAGSACSLSSADLRTYSTLDKRVAVLKLTPGLSPDVLDALTPTNQAVVLETFGIGGIPEQDGAWKKAIFSWVAAGRTCVVTTQVPEEGLDLGVYEVGHDYANHPGILRGDDMTLEAIVAKTMWVLGQTSDQQRIEELFYTPINHDRSER